MPLSEKRLPYYYSVLLVLFASLGLGSIFEVEGSITDLHRRWDIKFPSVHMIEENNTVIVDYGMSEELSSENVRTQIFTHDCEGPEVTMGILGDTVDHTTGAHTFRIEVSTLTKNETITTIDPSGQNATMKFCLRYSLWSGDEEDSIEINFLYNYLNIYLQLGKVISIESFLVTERGNDDSLGDRHEEHRKERHTVKVYLCDPITHVLIPPPPDGFGIGDVLTMCAEATQSIIDDAMYLKGVENFLWRKTQMRRGTPIITEQWAVKDGVPDGVSSYHCPMYALFCTFTTMLNAKFFTTPGVVEGFGSASLGFGAQRNLQASNKDKEMQTRKNPRTNALKITNDVRSLQQNVDRDESNMSITIPIKGPRVRPTSPPSPVVVDTSNIPIWGLWMITSAICAVVFGLAAGLYWREWYDMKETSGKH